jgi:predicted ABC-type transport system involved in lysophospholipase L1 biosynthesis ATPase subunit
MSHVGLGRRTAHSKTALGENSIVALARAARSTPALATSPAKMHEVVLAPPACPFS